MDIEFVFALLLLVTVVILPALAITARIALKPVISAILQLNEGLTGGSGTADLVRRVSALEETVGGLEAEVERIAEIKTFDRRLEPGPGGRGALPEEG